MKINWKQKLTSRKFWVAVVGYLTPLLVAFGVTQGSADKLGYIIISAASLVAYIVGESVVDAKRTGTEAPAEAETPTEDKP